MVKISITVRRFVSRASFRCQGHTHTEHRPMVSIRGGGRGVRRRGVLHRSFTQASNGLVLWIRPQILPCLMAFTSSVMLVAGDDVACDCGAQNTAQEGLDDDTIMHDYVWLSYIMILVLIVMSGLFSGLTLGLLSLDMNGLEIVINGDDSGAAEAAQSILPIRSKGNQLLCSLLLGNVAVNAFLSILMADLFGGLVSFIVSTIVIVIFGEIGESSLSMSPSWFIVRFILCRYRIS